MKFSFTRATTAAPAEPQMQDPFAAFHSETAVAESWHASPAVKKLLRYWRPLAIALVVIATGAAATAWFMRSRSSIASPATAAAMTVTSDPAGAIVFVDGKGRGITPISFTVTPGRHRLTLRAGEASQELEVTAKANVETVQHVMMVRPVGTTGSLSVQSEPPALQVAIDGKPRGVTPALVEELAPGRHDVLLTGKGVNTRRAVTVTAGSMTSLLVSEAPVEPAADAVGSVQVSSPIDVTLFDGDTLVGRSRSARLYLRPGTHTLNAVNEQLNFRRAIQVSVAPGATVRVTVPVPNGTLSVNAQPWAEVLLDGASLGETPIGNVSVPLGSHELVFRHPQLGERRQTVVVTAGQPVRVAEDLRK